MRRLFIGAAAIAAFVLSPASAMAQQTPCANGNPTDLCDRVEVVAEPAGLNCPNGGIKVIVVKGQRDTDPDRKNNDARRRRVLRLQRPQRSARTAPVLPASTSRLSPLVPTARPAASRSRC